MKSILLGLSISSVVAVVAYGEDCFYDPCSEGLYCVSGLCEDETTECKYCQDCTIEDRMWDDAETFFCAGEEGASGLLGATASLAILAVIMA